MSMYLLTRGRSWVSETGLFAPISDESWPTSSQSLRHDEGARKDGNAKKLKHCIKQEEEDEELTNYVVLQKDETVKIKEEPPDEEDVHYSVETSLQCNVIDELTEEEIEDSKYIQFSRDLNRLINETNIERRAQRDNYKSVRSPCATSLLSTSSGASNNNASFHLSQLPESSQSKHTQKQQRKRRGKYKRKTKGESILACERCHRTFKRQTDLETHRGERNRKLHCVRCDARFNCLKEFGRHTRQHRNFKCDKCNKSFSTSAAFKMHTPTHWDVKGFRCVACDKEFALPGHLKSHMLTHSSEYNLKCDGCDMKFKSVGSMAR